ncbi:hypothetical protein [Robertmurraya siralis]|uniref:hypothetical protein n=1 Tax=Robertmurraya siralis TaxID=77777 RepID=UPI0010F98D5B|nr:hypothetical protein [Robertmurraya siralis]
MKIYTKDGYWKVELDESDNWQGSTFNNPLQVKEALLSSIERNFNKELIKLIELGIFNKYK